MNYARARWQDPETGRFTSLDPARDGLNWYVYCANNPLRFLDSTGLYTEEQYYEGLRVSEEMAANERTYTGSEGTYWSTSYVNDAGVRINYSCFMSNSNKGGGYNLNQYKGDFVGVNPFRDRAGMSEAREDYYNRMRNERDVENLKSVQDSTRANDMYKKGGGGPYHRNEPKMTYCNVATDDTAQATGVSILHFLLGSTRWNTGANAQANNLARNAHPQSYGPYAAKQELIEVTPQIAQILGNMGFTITAGWYNPNGPGHLATVRPDSGPFHPDLGPLLSNVGEYNEITYAYSARAFAVGTGGADSASDIHFYLDPDQTFNFNPSLANRENPDPRFN